MNVTARKVIEVMADSRERTTADVAIKAGMHKDTAETELWRLHDLGIVTLTKTHGINIWRAKA